MFQHNPTQTVTFGDYHYWHCNENLVFGLLVHVFVHYYYPLCHLTLSGQRSLSYRNQSIDLLCKSMEWFLYDNGLCHE